MIHEGWRGEELNLSMNTAEEFKGKLHGYLGTKNQKTAEIVNLQTKIYIFRCLQRNDLCN